MSEAQPLPPPLPRTEVLMKRCKRFWRILMISNFVLGAYLFASPKKKDVRDIHTRTGHKLQKEKTTAEVPEPTTSSIDSIYDDESLFLPVTVPEEVRGPIPEEQQREILKWLLEEKRKVKPNDPVEKKQIDEEKAILKRILNSESIPKI